MKRCANIFTMIFLLGGSVLCAGIRNKESDTDALVPSSGRASQEADSTPSASGETEELQQAMDALQETEMEKKFTPPQTPAASSKSGSKEKIIRTDSFVAGPEWEFDGFVAGGEDGSRRSMYYLNDVIYINIGSLHGVIPGEKIGIYRRGDKVRDPQTGRFLGYEVKRIAVCKVSDRVSEEAAAMRISQTYEPVEIGDLVRRGE